MKRAKFTQLKLTAVPVPATAPKPVAAAEDFFAAPPVPTLAAALGRKPSFLRDSIGDRPSGRAALPVAVAPVSAPTPTVSFQAATRYDRSF